MSETKTIPITSLILDVENPRLAEGPKDQRAAIHAMLSAEGPKTLQLAEDILGNGLNPADRLIVTASDVDPRRFIVLEGNRRLTALKILGEPSLAEGSLRGLTFARLAGWAKRFASSPIRTVDCVVFESRKAANPWIERRHTGERNGVGVVRWGTMEKARFDERQTGKRSSELQVFDFVIQHDALDDETRSRLDDFNLSNLGRLIADKAVRDRLGIGLEGDAVVTRFPDKDVIPGLARVLKDIAHGLKVKSIYNASERQKYLDGFKSQLPKPSKAGKENHPLLSDSSPLPAPTKARKKAATHDTTRGALVPKSCRPPISTPRIKKILEEMQTLKLDRYANAIAVLFRVFVEMTADHHVLSKKLMTEKEWDKATLGQKLTVTAEDLQKNGLMTKKEADAIRKASHDKRILASNIVTFHAYVHNPHIAPIGADLLASWDNLQPFVELVWAK